MKIARFPVLLILGVLGIAAAPASRAAQAYDNCAGFIDELPAVVSTQGTWCLRKDLATAVSSGIAITVSNNNVTIDCNGFKVGGLAAGTETSARGIAAVNRMNTTVRGCNVRGFEYGISLSGSGHVVEDNRADGNTRYGIYVSGANSAIRRNLVLDTGGGTGAVGIAALFGVDILDNKISGVHFTGANGSAYGISMTYNNGATVADNRISDVVHAGGGTGYGISDVASEPLIVRGNSLLGQNDGDIGIDCDFDTFALENAIAAFETPVKDCSGGVNPAR